VDCGIVMSCSFLDGYQQFGGTYRLVTPHERAQRHNPKNHNPQDNQELCHMHRSPGGVSSLRIKDCALPRIGHRNNFTI
jgi:hypothetical protein